MPNPLSRFTSICICPVSINITAAWAVDWEFVYIMGSCGDPFGGFGVSFGVLLDCFGGPLGSVGALRVPSHFPSLPYAAPIRIKSNFFKFTTHVNKIRIRGTQDRSDRRDGSDRKWCQERWLGAHLPRTPGARMTVVTQTPSNYLPMSILICPVSIFENRQRDIRKGDIPGAIPADFPGMSE